MNQDDWNDGFVVGVTAGLSATHKEYGGGAGMFFLDIVEVSQGDIVTLNMVPQFLEIVFIE